MNYVTNGETLNLDSEYTYEFFCELKDKLSFAYELLCLKRKKRVVKDIILEKKFVEEKFIEALLTQDYDLSGYLFLILNNMLSITDLQAVNCGKNTDKYCIDEKQYSGDQYTFAELAYENDWPVVSFENITIQNVVKKIIKNSSEEKKTCNICNEKQFLICNCLKSDEYWGEYVSAFDNVYCSLNYSFEDLKSLRFDGKFKILSMYYTEIIHILNNELEKLSRFPGRNKNRVEKIDDGIFEYRIDNPNYRIYYTRDKDNLIILMGRLKKESKIRKSIKDQLNRLKNASSIKITT